MIDDPTYATDRSTPLPSLDELRANMDRMQSWLDSHKGKWIVVSPDGRFWTDVSLGVATGQALATTTPPGESFAWSWLQGLQRGLKTPC